MKRVVAAAIWLTLASAGVAQTRTARDAATTYGARLDARGEPIGLNRNRLNNRLATRADSRLSLRIERYIPTAAGGVSAALAAAQDQKQHLAPVIAAPPLQPDDQ